MWEIEERGFKENSSHLVCYSVCLRSFISFFSSLPSLQLVNPRRPYYTSFSISWFEVFRDTRHQFWSSESIPRKRIRGETEPQERFRVGSQGLLVEWQKKRSEKFRQLLSFNVHLYSNWEFLSKIVLPFSYLTPHQDPRYKEECVGENHGMLGRTGICDWPDDEKKFGKGNEWNGWKRCRGLKTNIPEIVSGIQLTQWLLKERARTTKQERKVNGCIIMIGHLKRCDQWLPAINSKTFSLSILFSSLQELFL